MRRPVLRGRRGGFAAFAILVCLFVSSSIPVSVSAEPTKLMAFGARPNTITGIRKNSNLLDATTTSSLGSVILDVDAVAGDRFHIILGSELQPPVPPLFASLDHTEPGCVTASWLPSGDPTVVGYVVSFGTASVAGGAASQYDRSVEVGPSASYTECTLPPATYYFAVQARNAGGVSAYSTERSISIQTVPVLISMFEATVAKEGVQLAWRVEADEAVQGYRVYRSEAGAVERRLTDELLPNTASSFVDAETRSATSYTYVLAALKENGDEVRSVPAAVTTPALDLQLGQNYPNPFNPSTKIPFTLEAAGPVLIRIFDVSGASVVTVFDGTLGEGRHFVEWSGRDDGGQPVASGIYLYSLTTGKQTLSKKMVMLK